jgi:hypothetical protein
MLTDTDTIYVNASPDGGTNQISLITTAIYHDPSAWYHVVFVHDSTQATSSNRCKLYINGVQVTSFSTATYPSQNSTCAINTNGYSHAIGRRQNGATWYFDGYLEEINFIDGQALTPSSFGAYNSYGVWSPAKYTGTYGTNGFYLSFQDNSALTTTANVGIGADSSGNGNYWRSNNISITAGVTYDSMVDVPTNTSPTNANYCVVNPVSAGANGISNGNLTVTYAAASIAYQQRCTFTPSAGQWYHEANLASFSVGDTGNNSQTFGWASFTNATTTIIYGWLTDNTIMRLSLRYTLNGVIQNRVNIDTVTPVSTDIFALAFDINTGTVTAYKNGVQTAQITSISNVGDWTPVIVRDGTNNAATWNMNFGQRPFSYTPPTGFNRLNTYNLPDSIVPVGAQYFAATTYTGTGASLAVTNTVNGKSFQPDFVWIKSRSAIRSHSLNDSVRGTASQLASNTTDAQWTATDALTAFNSNGFTLGANVQTSPSVNESTLTYVGWQWRASNASAVTNTSGTITSSVSANQTAGFSIVTYTGNGTNPGATIGHGLGVAPRFIIAKSRGVAEWPCYHASLPISNTIYLNATYASSTYVNRYSAVSATTFTTGSSGSELNTNAVNYVAYCFAAVPGYSAFGSYTGNGSADGPFVYTGFRPRWVMIKNTIVGTDSWQIWDTARNTFIITQNHVYPNLANAETSGTGFYIDILSNGFKIRTTNTSSNGSGNLLIYAAFAENPFKNALAR